MLFVTSIFNPPNIAEYGIILYMIFPELEATHLIYILQSMPYDHFTVLMHV